MKPLIGGAVLLFVLSVTACGGAPGSAPATTSASETPTPTPTPTVTVTETPTASAIATTGSYADDLAALGIKPDNMQDYAKWMKEQICDQDSIGLGVAVRSIGGSDAASGGGMQAVRLTNAYFCPEKTQEIEAALEYFNQ